MKIRTNKKILLASGIGLVLILVGVLAFQFQTYSRALFYVGLCLIIVGFNIFCVVLYAATTSKPKTELVADERVTRINEKAGNSAFKLVLSFISTVIMADIIWSLNFELRYMFIMTVAVGIYSNYIFRWYYKTFATS
ncbi:MAG TPA: DUF2178 domain-containing protein [Methanosarcinaceae archaeon]|nr:DUF2178 domain-containing protein [Methanosarcinaceae archaeon]